MVDFAKSIDSIENSPFLFSLAQLCRSSTKPIWFGWSSILYWRSHAGILIWEDSRVIGRETTWPHPKRGDQPFRLASAWREGKFVFDFVLFIIPQSVYVRCSILVNFLLIRCEAKKTWKIYLIILACIFTQTLNSLHLNNCKFSQLSNEVHYTNAALLCEKPQWFQKS